VPALEPVRTVTVKTHLSDFVGMSTAALVRCDDGKQYCIKRATLGRPLVAEHVVARLGLRIGAPCMDVCLAVVPEELIAIDPKLTRFKGGIAHGSFYVEGLVEKRQVAHSDIPINRARFARLFLLFTWTSASDHQFMYEVKPPHLVYSHDHGLFFSGGPNWNVGTLAAAQAVSADQVLGDLSFTGAELQDARADLASVTDTEIGHVVADVPKEWGISDAERSALVSYLSERRKGLLQTIPVA
jgi:hypothetical protein